MARGDAARGDISSGRAQSGAYPGPVTPRSVGRCNNTTAAADTPRRTSTGGRSTRIGIAAWIVLVCGAALAAPALGSGCPATHEFVGLTRDLVGLAWQLDGRLEVIDDCSFSLTMWRFDERASVAYWYTKEGLYLDPMLEGFRFGTPINNAPVEGGNGFRSMVINLEDGLTWDDVPVVYAWNELYSQVYGYVILKAEPEPMSPPPPGPLSFIQIICHNCPPAPMTPASPPMPPPTQPPPPPLAPATPPAPMATANPCSSSFTNCAVIIPNAMEIYWEADGENYETTTHVSLGVQTNLQPGHWMAFGFSNTSISEYEAQMVGSDVVIVGLLEDGETFFAKDYFLESKEPCKAGPDGTYTGVCPDDLLGGNPGLNNVELTCAFLEDGLSFLSFRKNVKSMDQFDVPWISMMDTALPAVYASGALGPGSTEALPQIQLHGSANHSNSQFRFNALAGDYNCPVGFYDSCPVESALNDIEFGQTAILVGYTTFDVLMGPATIYPNPPSPSTSFYLNGYQTPIVFWKPGQTYTFSIRAGQENPFYITSDINGGQLDPFETVYAGGDFAVGTETNAYVLEWTPDGDTPDVIFYHSTARARQGWLLVKQNSTAADDIIENSEKGTGGGVVNAVVPVDTASVVNQACLGVPVEMAGTVYNCQQDIEGVEGGSLFWSENQETGFLDIAYQLPSRGWSGMSFTPKESAGSMVPATAIVGWINADGTSNVSAYNLQGRSLSEIVPMDDLELGSPGLIQQGDKMTVFFSADPADERLYITLNDITYMNWALGPDPYLSKHTRSGGPAQVLFSSSGVLSSDKGLLFGPNMQAVWNAHGILMAVAFAILLPFGSLFARYVEWWGSGWIWVHLLAQVTGTIIFLASFIYILVENDYPSNWLSHTSDQYTHGKVGIAVCFFALFNPLGSALFVFCKKPKGPGEEYSCLRKTWELVHHVCGKFVLLLGAFNLYYGIYVMYFVNKSSDANARMWVGVITGLLMFWAILQAILDRIFYWWRRTQQADPTPLPAVITEALSVQASPALKPPSRPKSPQRMDRQRSNAMMVQYRV